MSNLSKETRERIEADALRYAEQQHGHDDIHPDYLEGAITEAGRAQILLDTLEKIVHAPVPANADEYISWFITAKNIAGGALSEYVANIELAKYKEVGNG